MIKTGRQIFKEQIFDKIDLTIKVKSVVSDGDPNVVFTVCDLKWLKNNSVLFDSENNQWAVSSIDYETNQIVGLRTGELTLKPGMVFTMPMPMFKSGTPRNLNGEISLDEDAEIFTTFPIVWLLESIKGKRYNSENIWDREFSFSWYVLDETSISDMNNEDRHYAGVLPMSQLGEEICNVIESNKQIDFVNESDFNEFNLFGRESSNGFESYILSKNLSGVGYRAPIKVMESVCKC